MCDWDHFCKIAREPCERQVGADACISLDGIKYQLSGEMAGEKVIVLLGLFDNEIFVEFSGKKEGPFHPGGGPIPLHTYRPFKKTKKEQKLDKVADLAKKLTIPRSVLSGQVENGSLEILRQADLGEKEDVPFIPFRTDEEPSHFNSILEAKIGIASFLNRPLATCTEPQRQQIDIFVSQTLHKKDLIEKVRGYFQLRCVHKILEK